jgi:redox-sensitive bicupin YhaK (pirin superfamily)
VSGNPEDKDQALFIHQDARIYGGKLKQGTKMKQVINHQAYVLVSAGQIELSGNDQTITMNKGDGAEVTAEDTLNILAKTDVEVIILDVPK